MYTEISSETHHSVNTCDTDDKDPQPVKRRKPRAAPAVTPAICHKHTPELRLGAPSPLVATTPELTMPNPRLIMDVRRLSLIIATTMPRELLGVHLRQRRRYHLLSIGNCPFTAFSNAPRSGVRRRTILSLNCY
jgi:hypothetical protein